MQPICLHPKMSVQQSNIYMLQYRRTFFFVLHFARLCNNIMFWENCQTFATAAFDHVVAVCYIIPLLLNFWIYTLTTCKMLTMFVCNVFPFLTLFTTCDQHVSWKIFILLSFIIFLFIFWGKTQQIVLNIDQQMYLNNIGLSKARSDTHSAVCFKNPLQHTLNKHVTCHIQGSMGSAFTGKGVCINKLRSGILTCGLSQAKKQS